MLMLRLKGVRESESVVIRSIEHFDKEKTTFQF